MQIGAGIEAGFHPLLTGGEEGEATSIAAGNDRNLLHRVVIGHQRPHQGMAGFVIGHQALALFAHHPILLLRTNHHPLDRVAHLIHGDFTEQATGGQNCCLIQQVGQISPSEARGATGHLVEVYVFAEGLAPGMHRKNLQAAGVVGAIHHHLAIKAARAQQGLVEHIRAVGGRHDDDAGVALKAIHLGEQLVERLLPLVVAATETSAALAAHRIDFIDEHDAGGVFLGLLEQIAHPAGTDTHEHLHELRTGNREEGHAGLPSYGLGEQGFTGTRGAHQQHPLGDLGAHGGEAIGIFEEIHHLTQFQLGPLDAGHVAEGHLGLGFHLHPGLALAEVHRRVAATALGAAQQEEQPAQ